MTPAQVQAVLDDCGDGLFRAATTGTADLVKLYGGLLAAALLAAEVVR